MLSQGLAMDLATEIGTQLILIKTGIVDKVVKYDDHDVVKFVKKGSIWYLSNEVVDQALVGQSNLTVMDTKKAIDDVFFYSLSSAILEKGGILDLVSSVNFLPHISPDVDNAIVSGTLTYGVKYVGNVILPVAQSEMVRNLRHISNVLNRV